MLIMNHVDEPRSVAPLVSRAIIAVSLVFGSMGIVLALLLWRDLKYTRAGRVAIALAAAVSAFVIQHALVLVIGPAPHFYELSRTVVLGALLVVIGLVEYSRLASAGGGPGWLTPRRSSTSISS